MPGPGRHSKAAAESIPVVVKVSKCLWQEPHRGQKLFITSSLWSVQQNFSILIAGSKLKSSTTENIFPEYGFTLVFKNYLGLKMPLFPDKPVLLFRDELNFSLMKLNSLTLLFREPNYSKNSSVCNKHWLMPSQYKTQAYLQQMIP